MFIYKPAILNFKCNNEIQKLNVYAATLQAYFYV